MIEFGAGKGCYTEALRSSGKLTSVDGYDGSANIATLTSGLVHTADLTTKLDLGCADYVLSFEVAEHIPPQFEETFLANLDHHNKRGIFLSWSNDGNGNGHVNTRDQAYVESTMRALGYELHQEATEALRASAKDVPWFRQTAMRFDRVGGARATCSSW